MPQLRVDECMRLAYSYKDVSKKVTIRVVYFRRFFAGGGGRGGAGIVTVPREDDVAE